MYELPPDPERLRVIRTFLQLQLAAVDEKIRQVEDRAHPGWRLDHIPSATGVRGRGMLHRGDCWMRGGGKPHVLTREDLVIALRLPRDEVEPCDECHPERDVEP
jgi:hypothetical protein